MQAAGEHNELFCALQDLGHIEKSIYIFSYAGDEQLQRQVERQLNKTENYNSLIDVVSWGQRGEMRLAARQDQQNRAACMRLVASIIILFNAAYLQAAVKKLRAAGVVVTDDQLAHIFPTVSAHIGFLGNYSFRDDPALATKINALPVSEPSADQLDLDFN